MSLDARLARISQDATIIGNLLVVGRSFLDGKEDASNNRARETDLSLAIIISQQYLNTDSKLYEIIDHHLSLETYQVASERLGNFMVAMTNFATMNQFLKL